MPDRLWARIAAEPDVTDPKPAGALKIAHGQCPTPDRLPRHLVQRIGFTNKQTPIATERFRKRVRTARLEADASFGRWRTQTSIASLRAVGLSAPWLLDGAMNQAAFDITPKPSWLQFYGLAMR